MAQFLGDIAWMLELFAVAGGLVLLHLAATEAPTKLLRTAGWLLVLGGVGTALCTGYYWFTYQAQGHFDSGHGHSPMTVPMPDDAATTHGNMEPMHRGAQSESPARSPGRGQ